MASKHDYNWTFGRRCRIRFPGGGAPINTGPQAFTTTEGCATISDGSGTLLFYTDGRRLYDGADGTLGAPPLGGSMTSCHSAIIIPPVGGGLRHHIFAVQDWETGGPLPGPLTYTPVTVVGSAVTVAAPPAQLGFGPIRAAERLAAVSNRTCTGYWLVSLNLDANVGQFHAMLIDSDAGAVNTSTHHVVSPYPSLPNWVAFHQQWMQFSPDGKLLALVARGTIDIMNFDRTTGLITAHSQITGVSGNNRAYGVEFSPDSKQLYFTGIVAGYVRRHTILSGGALASCPVVGTVASPVPGAIIGALQLGPNGKIYGARVGQPRLFEIGDPNNVSAPAFRLDALDASGGILNLNQRCELGLPTLVQDADDCDDNCSRIATEVGEQIEGRELHNSMRPCRGELEEQHCNPLEIPPIAPQTYIRWGDSRCDCIEGDDTEVMHLTICNPYSNLTLSNLVVHQLMVVDANGNPVPNLPDGTPSIQLVPVGPYCFDDLAPCTCVSREFVLRLRGAPGGPYRILVRGICFDACFHGDEEACFTFEVCKD